MDKKGEVEPPTEAERILQERDLDICLLRERGDQKEDNLDIKVLSYTLVKVRAGPANPMATGQMWSVLLLAVALLRNNESISIAILQHIIETSQNIVYDTYISEYQTMTNIYDCPAHIL